MAKITTDARNKLKASQFGLPGQRKYPLDSKARAANAKARATQMVAKGKLSSAAAAQIKARANKKLTGVGADLNYPGNLSAATPLQEDISPWKSRPVTGRPKVMSDSQSKEKGAAADSGVGMSYKKQPKFGGTQSEGKSYRGQVKIEGTTQASGKNYKNEERLGGTGMTSKPPKKTSNGNGDRWSNGSGDHDTMRGMVKNH